MEPCELLVIYPTYGRLMMTKKTLNSVISEITASARSQLLIHDCTPGRDGGAKRDMILELTNGRHRVFSIFSDDMSMGQSRNMCLNLGIEAWTPGYILMLEDDHELQPNSLQVLLGVMRSWYGIPSPNGLRYGMFSECFGCTNAQLKPVPGQDIGLCYPTGEPAVIGGSNSCFRAAPIHHWISVLRGYDIDEYPISFFQTAGLKWRNYHRGYTTMYIRKPDGDLYCRKLPGEGRATSDPNPLPLWDNQYCASDPRSNFRGK